MKTAVVGVIALVLGLGIGIGVSIYKVNAANSHLDTVQADMDQMRDLVKKAESRLTEREAELARLREELEAARSTPVSDPNAGAMEPEVPVPDTSEFLASLSEALGEMDESASGQRRGRFQDRFNGQRGEEEDEAAREERRRSYMDNYRQRMTDFMRAEIEASNDPAEKQRIASISEYMESLMDQRRLLREAQTDEERQAVFDTMRENAGVLRSMVEEQQDEVVRDSLERQGITSRSEQDAVIQAYKEAQDDPFFQGPFTFFGGRGYGMRGGGGPPPRGEEPR